MRGTGGLGLGAMRSRSGEKIDDDVVDNLKDWVLKKGPNFLVKWKSNIGNKKIDENMKNVYMEQQRRENDPIADEILRNILSSIQHVSIDSILASMKALSLRFQTSLNGDEFYIILNQSYDFKCTPGSNMFTSIMYLILNPDLVPLLNGFICGDALLNGNSIDPSIEHCLYVDDIAISGQDVKKAILSTTEYIDPSVAIHVMIPYCSKVAQRAINSASRDLNTMVKGRFGPETGKIPLSLYMDPLVVPKTLAEQKWLKPRMDIWKKEKGVGGGIENYFKRLMVFLLGKNSFNKGDVTSLSKITLFYTDINAPSDDSVYPMLLFKPSIFVPSGMQLKHLTGSIVSGCRVAQTENEISLAERGEFCVTPPHKNTEWTVFIQNLKSMDHTSSILGEVATMNDKTETSPILGEVATMNDKAETSPILGEVATMNDKAETVREIKRVFVETLAEEPEEEEMTLGELQFSLSKQDGFSTETIQDIRRRFSGNEENTMAEIKNRLFKRCELKDQTMAGIRKSLFGDSNKRSKYMNNL